MHDPLLLDALSAAGYETADPAGQAEARVNEAIMALQALLAQRSAALPAPAPVVPLRSGGRR
jgi:hypothetical protein